MFPLIDIHAHPQLKPLNSTTVRQQNKGLWDSYSASPSCGKLNPLLRKAVSDTIKSSQANFDRALKGGVRGVFLAMGPVERNFFEPRPQHWLLKLILPKRQLENFASCLTGFDMEKVEKIFRRVREKRGIDYYSEELLPEYQFISEESADDRMVIAGNSGEFAEAFRSGGKIGTVLTIEGAHSLGNYREGEDFWLKVSDADKAQISQRLLPQFERNILHMKKWGGGKHSPFFITFCHHFSNLLAGHSRSFPKGGLFPGMADLLDQRNGLNESFSILGWEVLEMLLSRTNGRRVLIDVKHMSVKSRMEYFSWLKEQFWDKGEELPVICSHGALNGYKTLEESLRPDNRNEFRRNYLSKQAINMSDEEARILVDSNGLVGIVLHGGRLPGGRAKRQLKRARSQDEIRDAAVELIMSNVFQFIRASNNKKAWNCLALGTDMDGVIEPLHPYDNYSSLADFPAHINQFFHRPFDLQGIGMSKQKVGQMMYDMDPEQLTEKLSGGNVVEFLMRYFNDDYLVKRA